MQSDVDEALLRGWTPGAAGAATVPPGVDTANGLLEVSYDDLVRALREVAPRPAFARRASAVGAQGLPLGPRQQLRAKLREAQLKRLTDRAMARPPAL